MGNIKIHLQSHHFNEVKKLNRITFHSLFWKNTQQCSKVCPDLLYRRDSAQAVSQIPLWGHINEFNHVEMSLLTIYSGYSLIVEPFSDSRFWKSMHHNSITCNININSVLPLQLIRGHLCYGYVLCKCIFSLLAKTLVLLCVHTEIALVIICVYLDTKILDTW